MFTTGEKIKQLRKIRGLSQEELAYQLNVARQTVSKWESDDMIPSSDNIVALCKLFNVSTDTLFYNSNTDNASSITIYDPVTNTKPDFRSTKRINIIWLLGIITFSLFITVFSVSAIIFLIAYFEPNGGYTSSTSYSMDLWFIVLSIVLFLISLCALTLLIVFRKKLNK